jgi:hypothetical protein
VALVGPRVRPLVGTLLVTSTYWLCKCGSRLERIKQRCDCGGKRPAKRVPKHARTLRDDSYDVYASSTVSSTGRRCRRVVTG